MAKPTRRDFLRWMGAGGMAAVGTVGWGQLGSEHLKIERHELRLPRWDAGRFKVAFLSDGHVNDPLATARMQEAIRLAVAEKPDVILYGGDFLNSASPDVLAQIGPAFDGLHSATCPCYTILGNHDYWVYDVPAVLETVRSTPMRLLRNEAVDVGGVTIFGLDDGLNNRHRPDLISSPRNSKSLIALFHEPDYVEHVPEEVSLQLSGHSHGGQVCLPGGIPIHTPKGSKRYRSGFYPNANSPLYVSRGIGTTGPNWRMFCPPEVSILTLVGT
jgi:uncharacterized protein